ncbi:MULTISPECIES: hypothetical protein [Streptomyces]|uniref:hypothetical protein n=1 Tax=Streptomyces TaxID=1883 RepID=UPI001D1567DE|nr:MULTISPECIES: hypothetical protein [Streptomyces]MCC3653500.1 hypothetical protein [Streptomyces sp. S07_1.15]WSQ71962.1 hypothetical protein OG463_11240 [Streptomyces xinghaiensis]
MRKKRMLSAGALALALLAGGGWAAGQAGAEGQAGTEGQAAAADRAGAADPDWYRGRSVRGWEIVELPNENVPNFQRRVAECPRGKRVLGGGAEARGADAILVGSFPTEDGRGWIGLGRQNEYSTVGISVYAICAYAHRY